MIGCPQTAMVGGVGKLSPKTTGRSEEKSLAYSFLEGASGSLMISSGLVSLRITTVQ